MQYSVVEEFVTSACETIPGLLTLRHQGKLALGLRGRVGLQEKMIQILLFDFHDFNLPVSECMISPFDLCFSIVFLV